MLQARDEQVRCGVRTLMASGAKMRPLWLVTEGLTCQRNTRTPVIAVNHLAKYALNDLIGHTCRYN